MAEIEEYAEELPDKLAESEEKCQDAKKQHQSAENRCEATAAKNRQIREAAALMQAEEEAVRAMHEAKLLSVQEEVAELERRVARFESGEDGFSSVISCSDASGNAIKFGLTPCGLLEVFKNGDPTSGSGLPGDVSICPITYKVLFTYGRLEAMKIDTDMPTDGNSASEAGSAAPCAVAEPRCSEEEIERERIRIQFRRDGQFRKQALRQWKCWVSCDKV